MAQRGSLKVHLRAHPELFARVVGQGGGGALRVEGLRGAPRAETDGLTLARGCPSHRSKAYRQIGPARR
eukprot:14715254-Alexandrium_andersonii.AAC.1